MGMVLLCRSEYHIKMGNLFTGFKETAALTQKPLDNLV